MLSSFVFLVPLSFSIALWILAAGPAAGPTNVSCNTLNAHHLRSPMERPSPRRLHRRDIITPSPQLRYPIMLYHRVVHAEHIPPLESMVISEGDLERIAHERSLHNDSVC